MKRMLFYSSLVFLLFLFGACSQTQAPPPEADDMTTQGVSRSSFRGKTVYAYFYNHHECGWINLSVFATDAWTRNEPGRGDTYSAASVNIESHNYCTGTYLDGSGFATLTAENFTVGRQLESAQLTTTIEIYNWWLEEPVGVITLDLTWLATGDLMRTSGSYHADEPGRKLRYHFQGTYRNASASGTVMSNGINLIEGLSGSGEIMQSRSGEITIEQEQHLPSTITRFAAQPHVIIAGQPTTLSWELATKGATGLSIEPDVGDVSRLSSISVSPSTTTTYALTATNRNGSSTAQVTVWVFAPDEFEPNNTPNEARDIPTWSYQRLTITPGDVDWFRLILPEATGLSVRVYHSWMYPSMFTRLFGLFDADLNEISVVVDDEGLWAELEAGTYYLVISAGSDTSFAGNHNELGDYTLDIGTWTPPPPIEPDELEPNDSPAQATDITIGFGFSSPVLTITPGDVDWFRFTLSEPTDLSASVSMHWMIGFFDEALNEIAKGQWSLLSALEPGTYYLAVSGGSDADLTGNHEDSGFYSLSVWSWAPPPPPPPPPPIEPDALEPNDSPGQATELTFTPNFYSGSLTITSNDVDWFRFTLTEAAELSVHVGSLYWLIGLFDGTLNEITRSQWDLRAELEPGTYYLAVSSIDDIDFTGNHEASGFYSLQAWIWRPPPPIEPDVLEPNNSPSEATSITLDYFSPELTITPGDVDWFRFTLAEAMIFSAQTNVGSIRALGLFSEELQAIAIDPRWGIWADLEPGTYYLAVSGISDPSFSGSHNESSFYTLSVQASPPPP